MSPSVSIIINCYNGEKYLNESINSILRQTFTDWELILYDNMSTDGTEKIFRSFQDSRFRYYKSETFFSLMEARNNAIDRANGEFIAFLDCDDLWVENKLELQLKEFSNETVGAVCGNYYKLNEREGKKITTQPYSKIPSGFIINEMLEDYFIHMSSLIFRKKCLDSLQFIFNPKYHIVGDLELMLRINTNWAISSIQSPVTFYRWHNNNSGYTAGFLYSNELDQLLDDIKNNSLINGCVNFNKFQQKIYWLRVIKYSYLGEKRNLFNNYKYLNNLNLFKTCVLFILPTKLIKKVVSYKIRNS